jgi:hypothetical protein
VAEAKPEDVQLAKLFAKMFIARPELKAVQIADGSYRPLRGEPFTLPDLLDHIGGRKTYGHYTTSEDDDSTKLFCFDIDLKKVGLLPISKNGAGQFLMFKDTPLREHWGSRQPGAGRDFIKLQLKMLANQLASAIGRELEIPTAVSYSGSKGVHVYGFTGKTSAQLARDGAKIVLDSLAATQQGYWQLIRGNNIYGYAVTQEDRAKNPAENGSQFELEVYPKQDTLDGKDKGLGNLLRLPCGVNLKSPKRDKGFFLDMRTALTEFVPRNSIEVLTTPNQWQ